MDACNIGSGELMYNVGTGRRGIEGKDIGAGFSNSYFPASLGLQTFNNWNLGHVENLEAKSIGWDATYALSVSQAALDYRPDRDVIFKAFRTWENARRLGYFTAEQKVKLRDPARKFHLEQTGEKTFILQEVK